MFMKSSCEEQKVYKSMNFVHDLATLATCSILKPGALDLLRIYIAREGGQTHDKNKLKNFKHIRFNSEKILLLLQNVHAKYA